HPEYDKILAPIKGMFGGNVQKMIVGSAPISPEVLTFFKIVLGIHIHEGYGQTEVSAPGSLVHPRDNTVGHVGGPPPEMKIRLKDVPEMGYLSTDDPPRGEVQFFGTSNFVGYFR